MKQNTKYSIDIDQNSYIIAIQSISLTGNRIKCSAEPLRDNERHWQLIGHSTESQTWVAKRTAARNQVTKILELITTMK